jgi:YedE family putative selenium metabolism protein
MHASLAISLGAGLLLGILAQRSRFCTVGALRDLIMLRDSHLFQGVCALIVAALAVNLALGQFKAGFEDQPIAHAVHIWNFLAMVLSGLCFTLAGGCPGRQIILSGEGDGDAGIFFIGMLVGAAMAHNFALAAAPAMNGKTGGPGRYGQVAVVVGIVLCLLIGWLMREPKRKTRKAEVQG